MRTYTQAELQELAAPHFEKYNLNTLYATSDGQIFIMQNRALLHAGTGIVHTLYRNGTQDGVVYKDHVVTVKDLEEQPDLLKRGVKPGDTIKVPMVEKPITLEELEEKLKEATNVNVLSAILIEEVSTHNRSEAVDKITARLNEVVEAMQPKQEPIVIAPAGEGTQNNDGGIGAPAGEGTQNNDGGTGAKQEPMSVKALTAHIETITDVAELQKLIAEEQAGQNRTTAVKAIQERIEKLSK